eukprot:gene15831-4779_t
MAIRHRNCFVAPFSKVSSGQILQWRLLPIRPCLPMKPWLEWYPNLTARLQGTMRWDASTQEEILRFEGHTGVVTSAIFSKDDSKVLSASRDNTIRSWRRRRSNQPTFGSLSEK